MTTGTMCQMSDGGKACADNGFRTSVAQAFLFCDKGVDCRAALAKTLLTTILP